MDVDRFKKFIESHKNCRLMIHNGFFAWSYGSPQNPLIISLDTAVKILSEYEQRTGKDANVEFDQNTLGLIYAEEGDDLCRKTDKNRIMGLYELESCIYTWEYNRELVHDFDI